TVQAPTPTAAMTSRTMTESRTLLAVPAGRCGPVLHPGLVFQGGTAPGESDWAGEADGASAAPDGRFSAGGAVETGAGAGRGTSARASAMSAGDESGGCPRLGSCSRARQVMASR